VSEGGSGFIARVWNWVQARRDHRFVPSDLRIGRRMVDGQLTRTLVTIPHHKRPEHLAVLGKTGSGKSSFLRYCVAQNIRARRGFVFFDLHGDATNAILRHIVAEERRDQHF
jgi:DNA helicase HerA-like ATPase